MLYQVQVKGSSGFIKIFFSNGMKVLLLFVLLGLQFNTNVGQTSSSYWNASIAQTTMDIHDPIHHYLRFVVNERGLNELPSFNLRPTPLPDNLSPGLFSAYHPWANHPSISERMQADWANPAHLFTFFTPEMRVTHNNNFAWGQNDGALWQGRGLNQSFSMGIGVDYGPVKVVLRPNFVYSENRDFMINPVPARRGINKYAIARLYTDYPDRFGEDPISMMDLGNSFIQYENRGFVAGFSNQSMWTGPAVLNPLVLSNNAPGFLHGFVGTASPYAVPYGKVEFRWFWGGLRESEYFDEIEDNNLRFVSGLTLNISPDFVPGLHLGMNRTGYSYFPKDGLGTKEIFMVLRKIPDRTPGASDNVDPMKERFTMVTFFGRYVMPESGFETYIEWGRNDYNRESRDFLSEPALNRGYTFGFIKRFDVFKRQLLVANIELTQLENSSPGSLHRLNNIWYANDYIRQGFTHRGQVLGAGIGPGSSAQTLKLTYYDTWGYFGGSIGRTVYQNDRLYNFWTYYANLQPFAWNTLRKLHEVEIHYGLNALVFLPYNLELQLDYRLGKYENRHNIMEYDVNNTNLSVTVRYAIRGVRF
jgi:hypothetical protein